MSNNDDDKVIPINKNKLISSDASVINVLDHAKGMNLDTVVIIAETKDGIRVLFGSRGEPITVAEAIYLMTLAKHSILSKVNSS